MFITTPLTVDGETFPFYSANLAISSTFKNGLLEACAAMRLVPTRLDEQGNSITSEENSKSIAIGTIEGISGPEQAALQAIHSAVQNYINAKGL